MIRRFSAVAFVIASTACTSIMVAADSPLTCIPNEAVYILKIRNIDNTLKKWVDIVDSFESLAKQELQGSAPGVQQNEEESHWGTYIRDSVESIFPVSETGADGTQDWWGFYWDVAGADSKMAYGFLIPAENPAKLKESLDQTREDGLETLIHQRGVIWANQPAMNAVKQCLADETRSVDARLPTDARSLFANSDLTIFVNVDGMKEFNPGLVHDAVDVVRKALLSYIPSEIKPKQTQEVLVETIDQFASFMLQSVNDTSSLTLSVTLGESDLLIEHFHSVKPGSETAALFRDHPGTEMKALAGLPANSVLYFACEGLQQVTTTWFTRAFELIHSESDQTSPNQFSAVRQGYCQLKYGTYAAAFPVFPIDQGYLRFVTNCEVDNPQMAHELDVQFANLGEIAGQKSAETNQTPKPTLSTRSTERLGDQSVDTVRQPFPIQLQVSDDPTKSQIDVTLLGPDGNVTRTACLQDRIIECVGGTSARAVAAIRRAKDAALGRSVSDSGFSQTRTRLSSKANLILMLDVGGVIAAGMESWNASGVVNSNPVAVRQVLTIQEDAGDAGDVVIAQDIADAKAAANDDVENDPAVPGVGNDDAEADEVDVVYKVDQAKIEAMRAASAFIGVSVALEREGSRTTLVIPIEAIHNVVKLPSSVLEVLGEFFDNF